MQASKNPFKEILPAFFSWTSIRRSLAFIGVLLCIHPVLAQDYLKMRDSLQIQLDGTTNDSIRSATLYHLAHTYRSQDPKAGIPYVEQSLSLAQQLSDTHLIARNYLLFSVFYNATSRHDSAIYFAQEGLKIMASQPLSKTTGSLNLSLANIFRTKNQLDPAFYHDSIAYSIFLELKDTVQIAASNINLGNISFQRNESLNALIHYYRGYQLYYAKDFIRGQIIAANNLGWTFLKQKNYASAHEFLSSAEKLADENAFYQLAGSLKGNLASIYYEEGDYERAINKAEEALAISEEIGTQSLIHHANRVLAKIYFELGDLAQSALYNKPAEDFYRDKEGAEYLIETLCLKSKLLLKKEKFSASLIAAEEALKLADQIELKESQKLAYRNIAYYYEQTGVPAEAFKYQKRVDELTELLGEQELARISEQVRKSMEINEMEATTIRLIQEKAQKEEALYKSESLLRLQRFIFVISIVLFALAIAFVFYLYKQNQFSKKALAKLSEQAKALDLAKREIEAPAQDKNRFFSMISHEIRTPLNAIMGMTHLIRESPLTEKQQEQVSILEFSSNSLLTLVNDLLDFNKLESGKEILDERLFHLPATCRRIIKSYLPQAQKKDLDLRYSYAENLPHEWIGDPIRIGQIIGNLLTNALKFTQRGMVHLKVGGSAETGVVIQVVDTGIGITSEKAEKIFEEFNQVDYQLGKALGGVGLGLPIAKKLAEAMGGTIVVQSQVGLGSTFTCTLPLPASTESTPNGLGIPTAERINNKGTILVAEDHLVNQKVVQTFLENWGYRVLIANNGREAIDLLQSNNRIGVVLMDMQMPVLDGVEATRIIRSSSDQPWHNIPIIAFTASVIENDYQRLKEDGISMILTKPIDPPVLQEAIRRAQQTAFLGKNPTTTRSS
ncbi:MAG: ATP-binding protein [Bacteroidota bacterium]